MLNSREFSLEMMNTVVYLVCCAISFVVLISCLYGHFTKKLLSLKICSNATESVAQNAD